MRSIVVRAFGEPDVLRLDDVDLPEPGSGEVQVKLEAIGVNPVDAYIRTGTYAMRPSLPYTPGFDGAGVVAAVGDGVAGLSPGDRVYLWAPLGRGTYAEAVVVPSGRVWRLGPRLTFAQGAAIGIPYTTAYRALHERGAARPGEWLLVHGGSGAVGTALIQIARRVGMRIIATAGTAEGREQLEREGVDHVLDHHDGEHLAAARRITDDRGLDLIVELLANANLGGDLTALARGGRVVVIGSRGPVEINPRDIMSRDAIVTGLVVFNTSPEELQIVHAGLAAGFADGSLSPVVGQRFSLADAGAAHRAQMAGGTHGKIILTP